MPFNAHDSAFSTRVLPAPFSPVQGGRARHEGDVEPPTQSTLPEEERDAYELDAAGDRHGVTVLTLRDLATPSLHLALRRGVGAGGCLLNTFCCTLDR